MITRALCAALLASAVAVGVQTWRLDAAQDALSEHREAAAVALAAAEQRARAVEQEWAANTRKAAQTYATQKARVRADADGARSELDRLRDTLASVPNAAEGAASAARADAAARLVGVVGECAAALATVAASADRTAEQLRALQAYAAGLQQGDLSRNP